MVSPPALILVYITSQPVAVMLLRLPDLRSVIISEHPVYHERVGVGRFGAYLIIESVMSALELLNPLEAVHTLKPW